VLSLGCGVAGMEDLWLAEQPNLRFTLVNVSLAQQGMTLCKGMRICMDAMHYAPVGKFDVIVLAYAAGHLDYELLIARAKDWLTEEGRILVLDIFDVEPETQRLLRYDAPTSAAMIEAGFKQVEVPGWHLHAPLAGETALVQAAIEATKPAMWVYRA
jgi:cyclopropane fatty-acyl-phospholipid synthase-like methyltransferase